MTERKELCEQCEDAVFGCLMRELVQEMGAQLLAENERLNQDAAAAVPKAAYRRGLRTIQNRFRRQRYQAVGRTGYRILRRTAVAALLAAFLFVSAFAASPELRAGAVSLLIRVTDISADLQQIEGTEAEGGLMLQNYRLPNLPEGFSVAYQSSSEHSTALMLCNEEGARMIFSVEDAKGTQFGLDTENAQHVEKVEINGCEGVLAEQEGRITIVFSDVNTSAFVCLDCVGVDRETALSLIEGVRFCETP